MTCSLLDFGELRSVADVAVAASSPVHVPTLYREQQSIIDEQQQQSIRVINGQTKLYTGITTDLQQRTFSDNWYSDLFYNGLPVIGTIFRSPKKNELYLAVFWIRFI